MEFFYLYDENLTATDEDGRQLEIFGMDLDMLQFLMVDSEGQLSWLSSDDFKLSSREPETSSADNFLKILNDPVARDFLDRAITNLAIKKNDSKTTETFQS